jgi:hypothetical protein
MKLKIVVVDFELSSRAKKWGLWLGLPLTVLFGAGSIAWANGLKTWQSGDTLQASDLNANFQYMQDQITALQQAHTPSAFRAHISNPASISIPSRVDTASVFDTVEFDLGSEYTPGTGVFSPKKDGTYLLHCSQAYATRLGGAYVGYMQVNGQAVDATNIVAAADGAYGDTPNAAILRLKAGDSVQCFTYQNSGTAQNLLGFSYEQTFSAARLD